MINSGIVYQNSLKKSPADIIVAVIQGRGFSCWANISLNAGNTKTSITITIKDAKIITNIGYINVPITLPLILSCFVNKSLIRPSVFSNSPASSPALTKPIKIYPNIWGNLAKVSAKEQPAIIWTFNIFEIALIFFLAASCSINIKDSTAGTPDWISICNVDIKSIFSVKDIERTLPNCLDLLVEVSLIFVGTNPIFRIISRASFKSEAVTSPFTTSFPFFNAS